MQTERGHTKRSRHVKLIAMLLAAAFLVTAVAIAPARAKHDQGDEDGGSGDDWHHEHEGHRHGHHWHEGWYEYHPYFYAPPPVVYVPPPVVYGPPPPVFYLPPPPSLNFIFQFDGHRH